MRASVSMRVRVCRGGEQHRTRPLFFQLCTVTQKLSAGCTEIFCGMRMGHAYGVIEWAKLTGNVHGLSSDSHVPARRPAKSSPCCRNPRLAAGWGPLTLLRSQRATAASALPLPPPPRGLPSTRAVHQDLVRVRVRDREGEAWFVVGVEGRASWGPGLAAG